MGYNEHLFHGHAVLRKGARLVCTDYRGGTHRLAGMHLAHQVVGLEHAAHAVGKAQRYCHRQPFGNGNDDERYGYHDGLEHIGDEADKTERLGQEEVGKTCHHDERGDEVGQLGNKTAKTLQLLVERRLHAVVYLSCREHLAVLRSITHMVYLEDAVAFHHLRAAQHDMGGIGRPIQTNVLPSLFRVETEGGFFWAGTEGGFLGNRLTRKARLVDHERSRLYEGAVGRYLHTRLQTHDVAHDNLTLGYLVPLAVTEHLNGFVVVDLVEKCKLTVCLIFEKECKTCCQEDGDEDADGLEEDRMPFTECKKFIEADADAENAGNEEDDDERIGELCQELAPQRFTLRWCQHVFTILPPAFRHLSVGQSRILLFFSHKSLCLLWVQRYD